MANEWFRHDYNAHEDIKQKRLLKRHGMSAIGFYWYLVELLYQNGGKLENKEVRLEAELLDSLDCLDSFIEFELFKIEDGFWLCKRVSDELSYREEQRLRKSEAGKKGMSSRWNNTVITQPNTVIKNDNTVIENGNTVITLPQKSITDDNTITNTKRDNKEKDNTNVLSKKKVFTKPTLEEISAYCKERHNDVDAETFFDFYESKDWMIGKNKMKDWKASVRLWERTSNKKSAPVKHKDYSDVKKEDFDMKNFNWGL